MPTTGIIPTTIDKFINTVDRNNRLTGKENIFSEESRNDRWPDQLHFERNILADCFSSIQWREKRRFP